MKVRYFLTPFLLFGVVFVSGCSGGTADITSVDRDVSPIAIDYSENPEMFDFGTISMREGNVGQTYIVRNTSEEPRTIHTVKTSCMCTTATVDGKKYGMHGRIPANVTLAAGEETEVYVEFDPNAHGPNATGPISRDVYLVSEDGSQTRIQIKGNVVK